MPQIVIAVIMVVTAVVSTVTQMQAANDQKKARQRQLEIEAKQREMTRLSQDLRLRREARAKEAMILNSVARSGPNESSSFTGAQTAVNSNLARELKFSEQGAVLAKDADAVTAEQIRLDASRQRNQALFSGISSVAKSVGGMAGSLGSSGTNFGSTSGADTGDAFMDQAGGLSN